MKFLETITFIGNDMLIPINRIKLIIFSCDDNGWYIKIKGEDNLECSEHFGKDEDKAQFRYKQIKRIIEAE